MTTQTHTSPSPAADKGLFRRGALAYVGLHVAAYERAVSRIDKVKTKTSALVDDAVERGETIENGANESLKKAQSIMTERYDGMTRKVKSVVPAKIKVPSLLGRKNDTLIEELEDEVAQLAKKLKALKFESKTKTAKTTKSDPTNIPAHTPANTAVSEKTTAVKSEPVPAAAQPVKSQPVKSQPVKTTAPKTSNAHKSEPRHIPYFNDVKRYDPFASEDVVRKIVNHCGIALRTEDARYVACTDETERNTVRESWLKRKLELSADDKDLDKKVLNVCSIMQRDNRKNRVTFYYLLAKAERKLETI